ncbi:MAG: hypothetical protein CSB44_11780 [Gammaproteobacteria bacterium]|nr:MAG: hypothetical protein CSB44_11780 [Gammaproteobacteria bacterium]
MTESSFASRLWLLGAFLGALAGCAATNPSPQPDDAGSQPVLDALDVAEAQLSPERLPVRVRWGGTIASVENTAEGHSLVEIVARPLARDGRPRQVDTSSGRFIAKFDEFVDPLVYTVGREMTVLGEVAELVDGKVGESPYHFPLLAVESATYWQVRAQPWERSRTRSRVYMHSDDWPYHGHVHGYHDWPYWWYDRPPRRRGGYWIFNGQTGND